MVTVKKPETTWRIKVSLWNEECPYLTYPHSIWACENTSHPDYDPRHHEGPPECTENKCPLKVL
jgi:hypothetical protein